MRDEGKVLVAVFPDNDAHTRLYVIRRHSSSPSSGAEVLAYAKSQEGADEIAEKLCRLFGFEKEAGRISCFAGSEIEVMYDDTYGRNGHLSVTANSIDRAYHYLKEQGVEFLEDTVKYNEQGKVRFVYLRDEIGGFAIHLY